VESDAVFHLVIVAQLDDTIPLFVYVRFETVVLFLPEKLRDKISALQFGRNWTAQKVGQ